LRIPPTTYDPGAGRAQGLDSERDEDATGAVWKRLNRGAYADRSQRDDGVSQRFDHPDTPLKSV